MAQKTANRSIWSFLQPLTHFSFPITFLASSYWGTTHPQVPHPKPLYIFTETICSELPQPDRLPLSTPQCVAWWQSPSSHWEKGSRLRWTLDGELGRDLQGIGVGGGDWCFFPLFVLNVYVLLSQSKLLIPIATKSPIWRFTGLWNGLPCMHNIYDNIGYIRRMFWHQSLFTQYAPICRDD